MLVLYTLSTIGNYYLLIWALFLDGTLLYPVTNMGFCASIDHGRIMSDCGIDQTKAVEDICNYKTHFP